MRFFSSGRTALHHRSLVVTTILQLAGTLDSLNNLVFATGARVIGVYERLPAVCDKEYRAKYPRPRRPHGRDTKDEMKYRDSREASGLDNDSEFLPVEHLPPEFIIHNDNGSTEFMDFHGDSHALGSNVLPILWNFTDTREAGELENNEQTRLYTMQRNRVKIGKSSARYPKKLVSLHRYRKANENHHGRGEEIPPAPYYYTMEDTFGSSCASYLRNSSSHFRDNRRNGWDEDDCKSMRRIVSGKEVRSIEQFPYIVFVDTGCGGAIIGDNWVLTAGHCVDEDDPRYVHGGSVRFMRGCQYNVVHVYIHPQFNRQRLQNDVALLQIKPAFVFSRAMKPIRMSSTKVRKRECGVVVGWGAEWYRGPPTFILKMTALPVVGRKRCRMFAMNEEQFCAGYQDASSDACQGDSGGPFVVNGILVGIVSYGYRCATPYTPGVYVDICFHRKWIRSIAGI